MSWLLTGYIIILKKEVINIVELRSTDWMRHIWKVLRVGAVLAFLSVLLPACYSDLFPINDTFFWYFGFWFSTSEVITPNSGLASDFYLSPYEATIMIGGGVAIALLIIASILMSLSSINAKDERNNKLAAGTGLLGGILAIIGPAFYYIYINTEHAPHWVLFDPSFGFYIPIIAGIVGIIGAIAAGYAFSLESKLPEERVVTESPYKPQQAEQPMMEEQVADQSQIEGKKFCTNCGEELSGPFCKACGTKAE